MNDQKNVRKPLSKHITGEALILFNFDNLVESDDISDEELLGFANGNPLIFKQLIATLLRAADFRHYDWEGDYTYPDFGEPISNIFYPSTGQGLYRVLSLLDKYVQNADNLNKAYLVVKEVWSSVFVLIKTVSAITGIKEINRLSSDKKKIPDELLDIFFLIRKEEAKRLLRAAEKFPELRMSPMLSESGLYQEYRGEFLPVLEYHHLLDTYMSIKSRSVGLKGYAKYIEQSENIPELLISTLIWIIFETWMSTPFYKGVFVANTEYTGISYKLSTTGKTFDLFYNLARFLTTPFKAMNADVGIRSTVSGLIAMWSKALFTICDSQEIFQFTQALRSAQGYIIAWEVFVTKEKLETLRPKIEELKDSFENAQYTLWKLENAIEVNRRNATVAEQQEEQILGRSDMKELKEMVAATLYWVSDKTQGEPMKDGRQAAKVRAGMIQEGFILVRDKHISSTKAAEEVVSLNKGRLGAYTKREQDSLRKAIDRKMKKEGLLRTKK